jgi:hypothetical protein
MLTQIYHKKNEKFEIEFFEDKECTKVFNSWGVDLYLQLYHGDITPLCSIPKFENIYIPYIPEFAQFDAINEYSHNIATLNYITPNLSKYIPKDNAVLFLDFEIKETYIKKYFAGKKYLNIQNFAEFWESAEFDDTPKLTIFSNELTSQNIQEINNIAKELKEKYGVEEVNVFTLHYFHSTIQNLVGDFLINGNIRGLKEKDRVFTDFNKLITTNSTSILPIQDNKRLQVIDCKEIFEEYLKRDIE